jgi:hypothetical protein
MFVAVPAPAVVELPHDGMATAITTIATSAIPACKIQKRMRRWYPSTGACAGAAEGEGEEEGAATVREPVPYGAPAK